MNKRSRRAILDRKDRKKNASAKTGEDVEMVDVGVSSPRIELRADIASSNPSHTSGLLSGLASNPCICPRIRYMAMIARSDLKVKFANRTFCGAYTERGRRTTPNALVDVKPQSPASLKLFKIQ
jgi:hypothetical protein